MRRVVTLYNSDARYVANYKKMGFSSAAAVVVEALRIMREGTHDPEREALGVIVKEDMSIRRLI